MNGFTTPTSRGGGSRFSSPSTSTTRRHLEHPAHRRLQSEAASSRFSSPSPSSDRSARCRSTSLAPSSVRKKDELDRRWKEIGARCLNKWEMLEQKYAHITAEDDDIVDITTLQIIVDRGVMRNARDSVFGENLTDEERSESSRYPSDEDEIGGWDDVSQAEGEETPAEEESDEEDERGRQMTEDDRWDLAEFLRKNSLMPNPDADGDEEQDHGYAEVEFPGSEEYEGEGEYDGPDRSESPDEEELQLRRHHRSGSMVWDSAEALFSDGIDMDNEDELAAADSDLEEATKRTPVSDRVQLSPDSEDSDDAEPAPFPKTAYRVRSEERERVSASAGPSRAQTPFAQTSRVPSQPASRISTTSVKKIARRRVSSATDSAQESDDRSQSALRRPPPTTPATGPKKRGRPRKHPLPVQNTVSESEHPGGRISVARTEQVRLISSAPATEPKKRGRPKGSKTRPKTSLDPPAAARIHGTEQALRKSRSLPSLGGETPTEAERRAQAFREVQDSNLRSEVSAGAMSLVTLDDLFSPPPGSSPAKVQSMLFSASPEPPRQPQRAPTVTSARSMAHPSAARKANAVRLSHRARSSSSTSGDKGKHRTPGQVLSDGLDPAYYHSSPHPTRGAGVKHCKACRVAGGARERHSDLCRGRMGISRCKFENDKVHDSTFGSAPPLSPATARKRPTANAADDAEMEQRPRPLPKQVQAVTRVRMSLGSEADDEASPSVHQRKMLKKRAGVLPQISRMAASMVDRSSSTFAVPTKSPRGGSSLDARVSEDDMPIDPELLAIDAAVIDNSISPVAATLDLPRSSDDSPSSPARKRPRQTSVFREPTPAQTARGYTRPRVAHTEAPEPPVRDGYAPNLYYRTSGSYRLCALCRRAGGEREKYAMYCPGRTQSTKLCSFEGIAPPKARAATPALAARHARADTPGGRRRYIPRFTPAPTPGPTTSEEELGRTSRKRKRVDYTEEPLDQGYGIREKENIPPRTTHSLAQSHLPTPSPSVSAPEGSTSISPSSVYRSIPPASSAKRVSSLAEAQAAPPPMPYAARGSSEALGWSWNRGSTPHRSILRRPSESSASEEPRSGKRIRFSHAPRSPSNGYSPAAHSVEPEREGSEDELLLHDNSSPPADDYPPRRSAENSPPISREWRIRAMDAGIRVQHHTGRIPSTLLKNIGPVQPNASLVPRISSRTYSNTVTGSTGSPGFRPTNPHIAALMLPPPFPNRATPTRIGLSPLSRELHLTKTPVGQSTQTQARRAVSSVPAQRTAEHHEVKRRWSTAPRKTAVEKDPDWVPGDSD